MHMQASGRSASFVCAWRHILFTLFFFSHSSKLGLFFVCTKITIRKSKEKRVSGLEGFPLISSLLFDLLYVWVWVFCLKSSGLSFNITFQVLRIFCLSYSVVSVCVCLGYKTMYTYFYTQSRSHSSGLF